MNKVLLMAIAVAITITAMAQQKPQRHHSTHKKHAENLQLTIEQKQQIQSIKKEYAEKFANLEKNDKQTLAAYKKQKLALEQEQKAKMQAVLTAEQKKQIEESKAKRTEEMQTKSVKRVEQLQQKLNLSSEQASQLKAQQNSFFSKAQQIKNSTTITKADKKVQMQQLQAERKAALTKILTPEQSAKLQEMRKQKGKMHKHES